MRLLSMKKAMISLTLVLGVLLAVWPVGSGRAAPRASFDPAISVVGVLEPGVLGLPGEPVNWIITVTNQGMAAGTDLVISDVLRDELRIDGVQVERGWQAVSGQVVEFTIPNLEPGETVGMQIMTTVLRGPADGMLTNRVLLRGDGPEGEVVEEAVAEIYVPTGLPATGYPPEEDWPGYGEPSVEMVALMAFGVVALTALIIYRRGQWSL